MTAASGDNMLSEMRLCLLALQMLAEEEGVGHTNAAYK
jgi:hypothetical protein